MELVEHLTLETVRKASALTLIEKKRPHYTQDC